MKSLVCLSFLALSLGYVTPPVYGEDTESPQHVHSQETEGDELDLAVQMTLHAFQEELTALRAMQDAASTAREAERLRKSISLRYKLYCMSFDYDRYKERCSEEIGQVLEACDDELNRLTEKEFFGVMPVRALFCSDRSTLTSTGETLRCATPLCAEEVSALVANCQEAVARYLETNKWLEGGPGFTRAQAWVIKAESDVIPRERHLLHSLWNRGYCGQSLHCIDGRYYDCLYILLTRDGEPCRMEQWFDISAYWQAQGVEN